MINKAEVKADPPISSVDHDIHVVVDGRGTAGADPTSASGDAIILLHAEADPGYEFVNWTSENDIQIINPTSTVDARFYMMVDSVAMLTP